MVVLILSLIQNISENEHKQLSHQKADESAAGEGQHPRQAHFLDDAEIDGFDVLDRSDTHNGRGFGVSCGDGQAEQRAEKQGRGCGEVG